MPKEPTNKSSATDPKVFAYRLPPDTGSQESRLKQLREFKFEEIRRKAERERRERNAQIAHDCRNEIQRMMIRIELIELNAANNENVLDDLEKIRESCQSLTRFLGELA